MSSLSFNESPLTGHYSTSGSLDYSTGYETELSNIETSRERIKFNRRQGNASQNKPLKQEFVHQVRGKNRPTRNNPRRGRASGWRGRRANVKFNSFHFLPAPNTMIGQSKVNDLLDVSAFPTVNQSQKETKPSELPQESSHVNIENSMTKMSSNEENPAKLTEAQLFTLNKQTVKKETMSGSKPGSIELNENQSNSSSSTFRTSLLSSSLSSGPFESSLNSCDLSITSSDVSQISPQARTKLFVRLPTNLTSSSYNASKQANQLQTN